MPTPTSGRFTATPVWISTIKIRKYPPGKRANFTSRASPILEHHRVNISASSLVRL